jgi:hypothetical protein
MHNCLAFVAIVATMFVSCTKSTDADPNQLINCAPLAIDPQNVLPSQTSVKTDAAQFVYDAVQLQKGMSGILHGLSADSAKQYQFHVYIFTAGRYYLLPSGTTGNNKYNFSVDGNTGYAIFSIYRTQGYSENVDAIKVIGVSLNYLRNQEYSLDYSDFASIKAAFGMP